MNNEVLERLREEYILKSLDEESILKDPIAQFESWFQDAMNARLREPNAMTLATSGIDFKPAARIVLLKGIENGNFIFYTNYESRKGHELLWNPYACLLFFWNELHRQVRIEGRVEKVSADQSDKYFHSRPIGSQMSAAVSPQSQVIADRSILEEKMQKLEVATGDNPIPRPDYWGGYKVLPYAIEFWQGRANRLHDRILFTGIDGNKWKMDRLAP